MLNAAGEEESRFQEKFYRMRIDLPRTVVDCSTESFNLGFTVYVMSGCFPPCILQNRDLSGLSLQVINSKEFCAIEESEILTS